MMYQYQLIQVKESEMELAYNGEYSALSAN